MGNAITRAGLAAALTNVALALCFLVFAYAHHQSFARHHRPSALLMVAIEALFALFFLIRAPADRTELSPSAALTTLGGTFLPMFLRPLDTPRDVPAGQVVQVLGLSCAIYAILSLNRSFGLVPAHRGVRSTGAYRWVRHPLYAAYAVMAAGYLASNFSG